MSNSYIVDSFTYTLIEGPFWECDTCKALVKQTTQHTRWHIDLTHQITAASVGP